MYPENDSQFEDSTIESVDKCDYGWSATLNTGWSCFIPKTSPIEPMAGALIRLYGRGTGHPFRGMFIDGMQVFYRTEDEDREYHDIQLYGADAADWLRRWDEGCGVWSIEMGGLGPGYEQCIQITAAEILRIMLANNYNADSWEDSEFWKRSRDEIEKECFKNEEISKLGLSGAQWGAALNLAAQLYKNGPRSVMKDERVKDRKIQVSRAFP